MKLKIICFVVTMTCAVLGKEGTIFPFIFSRKKITAKANWIGLYWISELELYFKPSLFTKSLFLICFISLTVIGWSYLSGWKGTVYKRWEMRWFTHCRPFTSIFASHPTALLFHWGTLSVSKFISPFIKASEVFFLPFPSYYLDSKKDITEN